QQGTHGAEGPAHKAKANNQPGHRADKAGVEQRCPEQAENNNASGYGNKRFTAPETVGPGAGQQGENTEEQHAGNQHHDKVVVAVAQARQVPGSGTDRSTTVAKRE